MDRHLHDNALWFWLPPTHITSLACYSYHVPMCCFQNSATNSAPMSILGHVPTCACMIISFFLFLFFFCHWAFTNVICSVRLNFAPSQSLPIASLTPRNLSWPTYSNLTVIDSTHIFWALSMYVPGPPVPVVAQRKWIRLVSMRIWVWSLASLSGPGIWRCCELWCRSQTWLGSHVAVAVG